LNGSQDPTQTENQLQSGGATIGRRFSGFKKKSPTTSATEEVSQSAAQAPEQAREAEKAPVKVAEPVSAPVPAPVRGRSYEPSDHDGSRVDTADAHEAQKAFSSFDQGPLDDMPAFLPDHPATHDDEPDEAAPPPVVMRNKAPPAPSQTYAPPPARAPAFTPPPAQATAFAQALAKTPAPAPAPAPAPVASKDATETKEAVPVQDRWAQIRKNAADRAAQRQAAEEAAGGQTATTTTTDNEGETSGEESRLNCGTTTYDANEHAAIESRVARIKARVAELTGNMEGNSNGTAPAAARALPARR